MKKLIIILCLLLFVSCASSKKNDFYKRKHPTENTKSYKSKQGLMLLQNTQLGRNKYIQSKSYQKKLKNAHKKYKK